MGNISYEIYSPAPHLRNIIRSFHIIEAHDLTEHQKIPGLTKSVIHINYGDPFSTYSPDGTTINYQPNSLVGTGVFLQPREYGKGINNLKCVVVDFHLDIAASMFQENMELLSNAAIALDNFKHFNKIQHLPQSIKEANTSGDKLKLLNQTFTDFLLRNPLQKDHFLTEIKKTIEQHQGNISIKDLSDDIGFSERTLRRRVMHSAGVTPSQLAKTVRSENAIARLLHQPDISNFDLIEELGYYDQAHFNKDMKVSTLLTPAMIKRLATTVMQSASAILSDRKTDRPSNSPWDQSVSSLDPKRYAYTS